MSSSVSEGAPPTGLKVFAVCTGLTALAVKQSSGLLVGDTKLDLVVNPGRFLGRALHLWDPSADFGLTQNQAYGYLFPMGPFFWLGRLAGLPPWLVQRLWWALILCVAFLGMVKLCARLGVGTPDSRLLAGVAFALSPRLLSGIGAISVESLPYCLAPWVLVPLVGPLAAASPRRAAARSAVAVTCMGAVNAAAVLATLPLAGLYLLTRAPGPLRRRLLAWWCASVVVATAWWTVPLVLLGRYSPPFLDFIETAATTTSVTSLVEVLRGTSDWVAYVASSRGPTWPAGWALLTEPLVIFYTVLVAAAGLCGLLRRDVPERRWLAACALIGLAALTFGHGSGWTAPLAGRERDLLDGVLAPFRNVHKFDVVLRVPLVIGLAHGLGLVLPRPKAPGGWLRVQSPRVAALAVVLGAALPAVQVGLAPPGPWVAIPDYWTQASTWLDEHGPGADLLLPGSSFPQYLWGHTNDEPLQPLAGRAWAVRGATPLTPAGTIRMLDAVESRLSSGRSSPGLALALRRAGIRHLLVRNDLDYGAAGSTRPLLVHEALVGSPGITRVAAFGGTVGGGAGGTVVDEGLEVPYAALEIYEVAGPAVARASLSPMSDLVTVAGGPESLLDLEDLGLLGDRPAVLAANAPGRETDVLTDGLRRREVFFGRTSRNASPTLTRDDPYRLDAPAHDYLDADLGRHQTVARTTGAVAVGSSSSASDPNALGGAEPEHAPSAAVDGDLSTWWLSDAAEGPSQARWSLQLSQPTALRGVRLTFHDGPGGARAETVRVAGDRGGVFVRVPRDAAVTVDVPGGPSRHLSVSTATTRGEGFGSLGLAEVAVPGVDVGRTLDTDIATGRPDVVLTAADGRRSSCFSFLQRSLCASSVASPGEEDTGLDRTLHLRSGGAYTVTRVDVVPRPGPALDALLAGGAQPSVSASSAAVQDPLGSAAAAIDGDPGTTWRAAAGDRDPQLSLSWERTQVLDEVVVSVSGSAGASRAREVELVSAEGTRTFRLDARGRGRFPALRTKAVTLHLTDPALGASLDPYSQVRSLLPVGVSEVTFPGAAVGEPPGTLTLPCGSGPSIEVDGQRLVTSLVAARPRVRSLQSLPVVVCGTRAVELREGSRVRAESTTALTPVAIVLRPTGLTPAAPGPAPVPVPTPRWGANERVVALPDRSSPSLLQIHENVNPGWRATLGSLSLSPLTVDGWQQGWVVPAGAAGDVRLSFVPDRTYRWGLVGGGLLLLVLPFLAYARRRRTLPAHGAITPGGSFRWLDVALLCCLGLAGGPVAVGATVVLALVVARRTTWFAAVAAGCLVTAGGLLAARPWASGHYLGSSGLVSGLCSVAIATLGVVLLPERRMKGRSIQR